VPVRAGAKRARGNDSICGVTGSEANGDGCPDLRKKYNWLKKKGEANKKYWEGLD